jgi:4-amino-4-deoxy-L-arabinose transferase-like glycosyltransferase
MSRRDRWTLLILAMGLGLLPAFLRGLWEPDEARYAEIPREMLATGNWLTPKLNGVLYFEKPPLQYWLSALSMKLFGVNGVAAKLPLLLACGLAIWAAYRLASRLGARGPVWASVMATTCLLGFVVGQILTLDALFSAFVVAALACGAEAVAAKVEDRGHLPWILGAHAFLAAAFLTKGLAAVVLLGGAFLFSLAFTGGQPKVRKAVLLTLFHPLGLLLGIALTAPWFVAVNKANPGHAHFFFIHEHFERFATHEHARQGSDNWLLDKLYFVPLLIVGLMPWLSASVVGLSRAWKLARHPGPAFQGTGLHRWTVGLALMAAAWPFIFFTFSGSKLPPYILPMMVPILALATTFEREGEEVRSLKRIGTEVMILGGAFLLGGLIAKKTDLHGARNWVLLLGIAGLMVGAWCRRPKWPVPTVPAFLTGLCGFLILLVVAGEQVAGPNKEVAPLLASAPADAQWISFGNYHQGIPFRTGQRVAVVAGTGELAYGRDHLPTDERARWFQEEKEALLPLAKRMALESTRPVWVLADRRDFEKLPTEQIAAFEVRRTTRNLLVLKLKNI